MVGPEEKNCIKDEENKSSEECAEEDREDFGVFDRVPFHLSSFLYDEAGNPLGITITTVFLYCPCSPTKGGKR